jgi:hypothetical protein
MKPHSLSILCHLRRSKQALTLLLLPFLLVYANGMATAWLIYECEWEDILTHHFQTLIPNNASNKELGRAYICQILDKNFGQDPTQPKPPITVPELRAVIALRSIHSPSRFFLQKLVIPTSEGMPLLGSPQEIFHPPSVC